MNWLYKLDYKYGRKAPKNLMLYIVGGQMIVWLIMLFTPGYFQLYQSMMLTRSGLMHFQVWRLVSFLILPPLSAQIISVLLGLYLTYFIGTALERAWGSFKFDFYFLMGVVSAWVACLLTGAGGTTALYYSLFFAFAYLYPEMQLMLFFVIPVKVKWLGYIAAALYGLNIVTSLMRFDVLGAASLIIGIANFLLFFGKGTIQAIKNAYVNAQRRKQWQNQWRDR